MVRLAGLTVRRQSKMNPQTVHTRCILPFYAARSFFCTLRRLTWSTALFVSLCTRNGKDVHFSSIWRAFFPLLQIIGNTTLTAISFVVILQFFSGYFFADFFNVCLRIFFLRTISRIILCVCAGEILGVSCL